MLNVLMCSPSFLWGLASGFGGLRGKGVHLPLREEVSDSITEAESLILSAPGDTQKDLAFQVTSLDAPGPNRVWLSWHMGYVGKQRCLTLGSPTWA